MSLVWALNCSLWVEAWEMVRDWGPLSKADGLEQEGPPEGRSARAVEEARVPRRSLFHSELTLRLGPAWSWGQSARFLRVLTETLQSQPWDGCIPRSWSWRAPGLSTSLGLNEALSLGPGECTMLNLTVKFHRADWSGEGKSEWLCLLTLGTVASLHT